MIVELQPDRILIKCYISVSYQVTGYRLPCMFYDHYDQSKQMSITRSVSKSQLVQTD